MSGRGKCCLKFLCSRRGDVFLLFAFYSVHPHIPKIVAHARGIRAKTVLVTDILNPAALPQTDVVLAAARGEPGEARSLAVPMAICNTFMVEVSRLDRGRMIRNLERLEEKRAELERPDGPRPPPTNNTTTR